MQNDKRELSERRIRRKKYRKRRKILLAAFWLFFALFLICAALSLSLWFASDREQRQFESLTAMEEEKAPPKEIALSIKQEQTEADEELPAPTDNRERFSELYEQNNDFIGWLSIENTKINYPVMCTPEEPDYYLYRSFDKTKSYSGTPFLGEGCDADSDNIMIYGHNMKNGTMFAALTDYGDEEYYKNHPVISFDTLDGDGMYEIIAVFRERVHYQDETGVFRYYNYGGTLTEEQFDEYIAAIKSLSLYETGISAAYGERLLTLSTCDYHTDNGRFVVVARKIE